METLYVLVFISRLQAGPSQQEDRHRGGGALTQLPLPGLHLTGQSLSPQPVTLLPAPSLQQHHSLWAPPTLPSSSASQGHSRESFAGETLGCKSPPTLPRPASALLPPEAQGAYFYEALLVITGHDLQACPAFFS